MFFGKRPEKVVNNKDVLLEAGKLYGEGFYNETLSKLLKSPLEKFPGYYIMLSNCYTCLGESLKALEAYDKVVDLYRESGDDVEFMRALKNRFEIERGIVEYYDLTCRYNFELSGDILSAIYDLESLKVGSVRKWDYYTQKTFYDVYKSVQDEVDEFNCGTSKRLNKTSCKGAERWLSDWRYLCEDR